MANVQVIQRNAHLASPVRLETVNGRDGPVAKAVLTAISNVRRGSGDAREEERTAILWTLWGKQAENAGKYLGRGSHVNIVGRLRNDHYRNAEGDDVFGFDFTCEEIDYLDTKAEGEALRAKQVPAPADGDAATRATPAAKGKGAKGRKSAAPAAHPELDEHGDPIPF